MRTTALLAMTVGIALAVAPAAFADGTVSTPISGLDGPVDVASGDFDGNGRADLAIAEAHGLVVQRSQAGGGFTSQALVVSGEPASVATGDLDRDGQPDVATVSTVQRVVDVKRPGRGRRVGSRRAGERRGQAGRHRHRGSQRGWLG